MRHRIIVLYNSIDADRFDFADVPAVYKGLNFSFDFIGSDNFRAPFFVQVLRGCSVLIISSNVFSNYTTRDEFQVPIVQAAPANWLEDGGRVLFFAQHRLAKEAYPLGRLLPSFPDEVRIQVRPRQESPLAATLGFAENPLSRKLRSTPNSIDVESYSAKVSETNGYNGVYWSFPDPGADHSILPVVQDVSTGRILTIIIRPPSGGTIVYSAIAFDWHKRSDILENLLYNLLNDFEFSLVILGESDTATNLKEIMRGSGIAFRDARSVTSAEEKSLSLFRNVIVVGDVARTLPAENVYRVWTEEKRLSVHLPIFSDHLVKIAKDSEQDIALQCATGLVSGHLWETIACIAELLLISQLTGIQLPRIREACDDVYARLPGGSSYNNVYGQTLALFYIAASSSKGDIARISQILKWLCSHIRTAERSDLSWSLFCFATLGVFRHPTYARLIDLTVDRIIALPGPLSDAEVMRIASFLAFSESPEANELLVTWINRLGELKLSSPLVAKLILDTPLRDNPAVMQTTNTLVGATDTLEHLFEIALGHPEMRLSERLTLIRFLLGQQAQGFANDFALHDFLSKIDTPISHQPPDTVSDLRILKEQLVQQDRDRNKLALANESAKMAYRRSKRRLRILVYCLLIIMLVLMSLSYIAISVWLSLARKDGLQEAFSEAAKIIYTQKAFHIGLFGTAFSGGALLLLAQFRDRFVALKNMVIREENP